MEIVRLNHADHTFKPCLGHLVLYIPGKTAADHVFKPDLLLGLVEGYDLPSFFPCFIVPNAPGMV